MRHSDKITCYPFAGAPRAFLVFGVWFVSLPAAHLNLIKVITFIIYLSFILLHTNFGPLQEVLSIHPRTLGKTSLKTLVDGGSQEG